MIRTSILALCVGAVAFAADAAPAPADTKPAPVPSTTPAPVAATPGAKPTESTPVDKTQAQKDLNNLREFMHESPKGLTTKQKASYLIGTNMAGAVKEYDLDVALVLQAIQDTVAGKPSLIPKEESEEVFKKFQAEVESAKAKLGDSRQATNVAWLAANAKKPNIKTTASGLQYEVVAATAKKDAKQPTATDQVKVNYAGTLLDGTEFDASAKHGGPATFGVGQVIKGWTEGLQLMKEGDKFKFYIPSELAYGEKGPESIGANQVLIFDVELLEVLAAAKAPETFKP